MSIDFKAAVPWWPAGQKPDGRQIVFVLLFRQKNAAKAQASAMEMKACHHQKPASPLRQQSKVARALIFTSGVGVFQF